LCRWSSLKTARTCRKWSAHVTVNQNIVKEHQHKAAEEWPKDVVHHGLERGWGVAQSKSHDQEFVEAVAVL
jgi:hypothetical protein